ncbi:hypothetical protein [Cryptosporangium phraense]|uniref:hypothetical protein n=1 Tax=Cryptosporangium phraense TaxID=2593070 RepID=UPI00197A9B4D|nr:hypothetical protein [Cryptosporangium phraense]
MLLGHSSGAQVVAEAAAGRADVAVVVLVSPIVDPAVRRLPVLAFRWLFDGRGESRGLLAGLGPAPGALRRGARVALVLLERPGGVFRRTPAGRRGTMGRPRRLRGPPL